MPSNLALAVSAAIVVLALLASAPVISLLQGTGERRRWPRLRRIAWAAAVAIAVLRAEAAALQPLFGAAISALLPLGRLPWLAVAGDEGDAIRALLVQAGLLAGLAIAFGLPFLALGTSVGFAILPRPTIRLRRALATLLATSGALLLLAFVAGSWRGGGLDPRHLRDRVADGGLACLLWPIILALLGASTRRLFPTSAAAEVPLEEEWTW